MYDSKNNIVKIIDFGMSVNFKESLIVDSTSGSPMYTAPEVLLGDSHDPTSSDIWSLGIILYYMLVGDYPWENVDTVDDLIDLFSTQTLNISYPQNISSEMQDLINKILVIDPQKKIKIIPN